MKQLTIENKSYPIIQIPGRPPSILDRHVSEIYEVSTREINQAVARNRGKFPEDFCFELTKEEQSNVTKCDITLSQWFTRTPRAFTWEGCNMLATILKSDIATQRAIQIVRGFTTMEKLAPTLSDHPLMVSARQLLEITEKYVQVEEEQKRLHEVQEKQAFEIFELQAKTSAYMEKTGYYSILAYARTIDRKLTRNEAAEWGKKATLLSNISGTSIGKVPDERWGSVNTYHKRLLDELFQRN